MIDVRSGGPDRGDSSPCRKTAALAGESSALATAYGDSYACSWVCLGPRAPAIDKLSGSDRVDLRRLLLPEEELE